MLEANNREDRIDLEIGSDDETASNNHLEAIDARNIIVERGGNHRG